MTDEIDDAQPNDTTIRPELPDAIASLGIEAQAEYLRARQRLGLSLDPAAQLGTVGRYRLEEEIGRGGMGVVYRARDPELDRQVAIKLVQGQPFARYDQLRARLLKEAKVLAKLTHPNVVRVYDCGQHEGEVYLAMEFVEGSTLRHWQQGRPHRSILDAYAQAARGLAAAHDLNIIHRDFKPDNVLVAADGRVLVGDFGLAGLVDGGEAPVDGPSAEDSKIPPGSATRTGALLGTPTYMAPEQLRGELATPSSDQFAFCVSLWEALTGGRPFEAEDKEILLEQIDGSTVVGAEKLPRRLRTPLLKGLAVDPAARFEHVEELADAIQPRRSMMGVGLVLVLTLAAGLFMGRALQQKLPEEQDLQQATTLERCEIQEEAKAVRSMPQWATLRTRLEDSGLHRTYTSLHRNMKIMKEEAGLLCPPGSSREAKSHRQWISSWLAFLRSILEAPPARDLWILVDGIDELERTRWRGPPPAPLDEDLIELVEKSQRQLLELGAERALESAQEAVTIASSDAKAPDLAHAFRWRGRIFALLGRSDEAMGDYSRAITHASASSRDDIYLEIELLFAKTAVMREGNLPLAQASLDRALGVLLRPTQPWLTRQRADFHELLASVLKHKGIYDAALDHQRYSLLLNYLQGNWVEIGAGLQNLGTIHEFRGTDQGWDIAGSSYEYAYKILEPLSPSPQYLQAAFSLGHWLAFDEPSEEDRATRLLEEVIAKSDDLRVFALTDLILLSLERQVTNTADVASLLPVLRQLEDAVSKNDPPIRLDKRVDALAAVAIGYGVAGDSSAYETSLARLDDATQYVALKRRVHNNSDSTSDRDQKRAEVALSVASILHDFAPARARIFAESARRYSLELPDSEHRDMMLSKARSLLQ